MRVDASPFLILPEHGGLKPGRRPNGLEMSAARLLRRQLYFLVMQFIDGTSCPKTPE
jgi:hypothetical protein